MSKICDEVVASLKNIFPELNVKTEHYVNFRGQKLFVDIWVPQLNLAIEVHGDQHRKFVSHFHKDEIGYKRHRRRDSLKEEWASLEGIIYIVLFKEDLPITADKLLELMRRNIRVL